MNRRSLMTLIGLAPVAVGGGGRLDAMPPYPQSFNEVAPALASGPSSHEVMRMAYKAGLFPETMFRRAISEEHGGYRPFAHERTIEGYRSFSAVAKYRLLQEAREEHAWRRFWSEEDRSYYGLAQQAREMLGLK